MNLDPWSHYKLRSVLMSTDCFPTEGHLEDYILCCSLRSYCCALAVLQPEVLWKWVACAVSWSYVHVQDLGWFWWPCLGPRPVHDLCGLQKTCGGAWSMHPLIVKNRVTYVVTADAQLRGRDLKGFCDNSHKYRYTDNTNWTFLLFFYFYSYFCFSEGLEANMEGLGSKCDQSAWSEMPRGLIKSTTLQGMDMSRKRELWK